MSEASSMYFANDIFSPAVIQGIFDVIEPLNPDDLKLQKDFFPEVNFTTDEAINYFQHNFWGKTPATALGAEPMHVGIPGGFYKKYDFGYWGEYSRFDSKDLVQVKNPIKPYKEDGVTPNLWGEDMVAKALAHQKYRFNTLKEAFCSSLLSKGYFNYYGDGINNYFPGPTSSNYILDSHYRLDCTSAGAVSYGGWTTGGTWATASSATPTHDLNQKILYMAQKLGLQVTKIIMSRKAAQYLIDADETASWVEKNPELSRAMLTVESGLTALNKVVGDRIGFEIDDRTYAERMVITTPTVASTSTTVTVDNDAPLDSTTATVTFRKADGRERLITLSNVASNTLTWGTAADLDISMDVGDYVIYNKRFIDENKVIFKTNRIERQRWAFLPCQTSPEDPYAPGVHTYSQEVVKKPNWHVIVGTFARCGALVSGNGGWATLKVFS